MFSTFQYISSSVLTFDAMRKFITGILTIMVVAIGFLVLHDRKTACERPLRYRIGHIDDRFGIHAGAFLASIRQAENLWEESVGLNLFEYDATATFTINLFFDARQKATIEQKHLKNKLKQIESSHANIAKSYEDWVEIYNTEVKAYKQSMGKYRKRVQAFNDQVKYWNNVGGAPQQEFIALEEEEQQINMLQSQLESTRVYLNEIADMLKFMEKRSNSIVSSYKTHIKTYNSLHGEHTRFNQGEYDGKAITIYQFSDTTDLLLVIAHELGHTLGLGHVDDPTAVMHYLMGEQGLDPLTLAADDINSLKAVCGLP